MLKAKRSIRKSLFSLFTGQALTYAITLIQTPYLTRHLAPSAFGLFSFSNVLLVVSISIIGYAANNTTVFMFRKHAGMPLRRSLIFWNQIAAQITVSLCLCALMAAWIVFSDEMRKDATVFAIVAFNFLLMGFYSPWLWASIERFHILSILNVGSRLLSLMLIVLTVHDPGDIEWAVAAVVFPNIVSAGIFVTWLLKERAVLWIPPSRWRPLSVLHKDFYIAISTYAVVLQTSIGLLITKFLLDAHDYGFVTFADRFRALSYVAIGTIGGVLFSRFCGERVTGPQHGATFGRKSAATLTSTGLIIGTALSILAYPAVIILGGREFLPALPLVYFVALMLPFMGLNYYLTYFVLNVFGLAKPQMAGLIGTSVAIAAALVMKPEVSATYAMAVIAAGEIARTLIACVIIRRAGFYVFRPGIARPLKTAA